MDWCSCLFMNIKPSFMELSVLAVKLNGCYRHTNITSNKKIASNIFWKTLVSTIGTATVDENCINTKVSNMKQTGLWSNDVLTIHTFHILIVCCSVTSLATTELNSTCNMGCGCTTAFYEPVCFDNVQYFSPCHAGCYEPAQDNGTHMVGLSNHTAFIVTYIDGLY